MRARCAKVTLQKISQIRSGVWEIDAKVQNFGFPMKTIGGDFIAA
jgi:hypothetical protein